MRDGVMGSGVGDIGDTGGAPASIQGRDINARGVGPVCSNDVPVRGGGGGGTGG